MIVTFTTTFNTTMTPYSYASFDDFNDDVKNRIEELFAGACPDSSDFTVGFTTSEK